MPFRPDPFLRRFEPLRRARRRPVLGLVVAVGLVAVAAGFKWATFDLLVTAPFITFYPAIVLATFVGGIRAGVLAAVLSAAIANFAFVPPFFAFSTSPSAIVATALFLL